MRSDVAYLDDGCEDGLVQPLSVLRPRIAPVQSQVGQVGRYAAAAADQVVRSSGLSSSSGAHIPSTTCCFGSLSARNRVVITGSSSPSRDWWRLVTKDAKLSPRRTSRAFISTACMEASSSFWSMLTTPAAR